MRTVTVRVLRSHIVGPGQIAEVGDVLELPEHVATLRINIGMCEPAPAEPPPPVADAVPAAAADAGAPDPVGPSGPAGGPAGPPTAGPDTGGDAAPETTPPTAPGADATAPTGQSVDNEASTTTSQPAADAKPAGNRRSNRS